MAQDLRFPIGKFDSNEFKLRPDNIKSIAALPTDLNDAVGGLNESQLDTPYRDGGWTVRQTVHHVADSHANCLIRFKLALTEDEPPTIRPYYEDRWAELPDNKLPIDVSIKMIDGIHVRWTALLESMSDADFSREFIHPETGRWQLDRALALYAWHGLHHTAHISHLNTRMNW
ncbi:MAG: YfiT family bacillithiol transferase [Pyrinomonadaceae bacterium]